MIKKTVDYMNKNIFNLNKDNKYISYFLFSYNFLKKTNYISNIMYKFVFTFIFSYVLRKAEIELFSGNSKYELYYLILYIIGKLCDMADDMFYDNFKNLKENNTSVYIQKEQFLLECKIPFYMRQKMDIKKYRYLSNNVYSNIDDIVDFILIVYRLLISLYFSMRSFIDNNMINYFIILNTALFMILKNYIYPLMKNSDEIFTKHNLKRDILLNDRKILNFYFIPFVENLNIFNKKLEKDEKIKKLDLNKRLEDSKPRKYIMILANSIIIFAFYINYMNKLGKYYIFMSTINTLCITLRSLMSNIDRVNSIFKDYEQYLGYMKIMVDDTNFAYASKITYPLIFDININIYENYILNGKLEINEKDLIFITGESGVGKSTLSKKIVGYDFMNENEVIYRKFIYYITQEYNESWSNSKYIWSNLFQNMNNINQVKEYLEYFAFPMNKFNDKDTIDSEVPILSGGERKRLQYAILFNRDIKEYHQIVVLDEPHKDLDENTALKMISGIKKLLLKINDKMSIIIIKHEKPQISEFSEWKEWRIDNNGKIHLI